MIDVSLRGRAERDGVRSTGERRPTPGHSRSVEGGGSNRPKSGWTPAAKTAPSAAPGDEAMSEPKNAKKTRTLTIDIGGTGIKMLVLDESAAAITERARVETPSPATPEAVLNAIATLVPTQGPFDRVSVGFPGVVTDGVVSTAPNLGTDHWRGFDLASALETGLGKPVRVCNDADVQGFGAIEGKGVELVLTLGTGVGSALFLNGRLVPNLELGHHIFRGKKSYEDCLGKAALEEVGKKKWRKRVRRAVKALDPIFNYRVLYLGGGNTKLLDPAELPSNVKTVDNLAGLLGGIALWR
jgi:polyphosphate glucokinase